MRELIHALSCATKVHRIRTRSEVSQHWWASIGIRSEPELIASNIRMRTAYWWVGPRNAVRDRASLSLSNAVVSGISPSRAHVVSSIQGRNSVMASLQYNISYVASGAQIMEAWRNYMHSAHRLSREVAPSAKNSTRRLACWKLCRPIFTDRSTAYMFKKFMGSRGD